MDICILLAACWFCFCVDFGFVASLALFACAGGLFAYCCVARWLIWVCVYWCGLSIRVDELFMLLVNRCWFCVLIWW